ncbi:amino acid adenylation domain-containing protein (plasmid) [Pseudohalocynthiibacter aestuariivivens]|uniref:Amino acid adenylation domain-containing protein n=1 Tax=Roseovarius pelagicus TaxID=2980108 RepID=A0ABY6D5I5_9RHOB|nr:MULTISPECIES: amino acid adenylation domain-containing protein [Rhodobacterales]QIE47926.1 amino acid adenylation domain-containing protein [Pseudohalocynthiibacter aestuariivivens]UXX81419.1 amino acid adenylation domain-containing protein [Roseovarius pelagicus]
MRVNLLHEMIDRSADRDPEQEAFRFLGNSLTYQALASLSSRLAGVLMNHGVRRGDRVGIYMNKALETPVAIFGILKAGAAYVPIDPGAPVERVATMLQHCGVRHLITGNDKRTQIQTLLDGKAGLDCVIGLSDSPKGGVQSISWDAIRDAPPVAPAKVIPEDIAYIMYTSGSTGRPKGITHTHSSGLSYARAIADLYAITASDRFGNHSPLHFDISLFDYLCAPLCGATTIIIPEPYTKLPASLSELMETERMTVWFSAPHALTLLLLRGVLDKRDLTTLRWVIFGGEPFPPKYLGALMAQWPHARFSNSYGPAEVNMCTYHHVDEPVIEATETIPIGRAWGIAEALIVDENDHQVVPGAPGELLIRSPTRMRSYWRAPALNAACFYRRNVTDDIEDVFYRTGDIVAEDSVHGMLFLGRKDRQIKIRGFRIELDEVEAVLAEHDSVEEAGSYTARDGTEIEAAVTIHNHSSVAADDLLRHCADRLPPYAIPQAVHIIDAFPRTTSQKIDRRALAAQFDAEETD